ncbi:hypothetical protein Scep_001629 [Stephania cephalantha]|uniref:Uncharacterized protein n=1 Tax=Stephania cephalantha TaxID=152367 RepID=A0AAP0L8E9_9MAGN
MACVDMYNSDHQNGRCAPPMSPRISFSSDFIDAQHMIKYERTSRDAPAASSDFEFSVSNYNMMAADELFSKGRLLPFKDSCTNQLQKMTLRDELLIDDDGANVATVSSRPPKSTRRWKELLGMKRSTHINVSKRGEKSDGSVGKGSNLSHGEEAQASQSSQERLTDGGSSQRNVEIGV